MAKEGSWLDKEEFGDVIYNAVHEGKEKAVQEANKTNTSKARMSPKQKQEFSRELSEVVAKVFEPELKKIKAGKGDVNLSVVTKAIGDLKATLSYDKGNKSPLILTLQAVDKEVIKLNGDLKGVNYNFEAMLNEIMNTKGKSKNTNLTGTNLLPIQDAIKNFNQAELARELKAQQDATYKQVEQATNELVNRIQKNGEKNTSGGNFGLSEDFLNQILGLSKNKLKKDDIKEVQEFGIYSKESIKNYSELLNEIIKTALEVKSKQEELKGIANGEEDKNLTNLINMILNPKATKKGSQIGKVADERVKFINSILDTLKEAGSDTKMLSDTKFDAYAKNVVAVINDVKQLRELDSKLTEELYKKDDNKNKFRATSATNIQTEYDNLLNELADIYDRNTSRKKLTEIKGRHKPVDLGEVAKIIEELKNNVNVSKNVDTLKLYFKQLNNEVKDLKPQQIQENLDKIQAIRNIWGQLKTRGQGNVTANLLGEEFKAFNSYKDFIEKFKTAIKNGHEVQDVIEQQKYTPVHNQREGASKDSGKSKAEKAKKQLKEEAKVVKEAAEEYAKTVDNAKEKIQKSLKNLVDDRAYKTDSLEAIQERVNKLLSGLTYKQKTDDKGTVIKDAQGKAVKELDMTYGQIGQRSDIQKELMYRLQMATEVNDEFLTMLKLLDELKTKTESSAFSKGFVLGDQEVRTVEQLHNLIPMFEQIKGATLHEPIEVKETEVAQTAKQVEKDTKKLSDANKKAEEEVAKTEQVQGKAKKARGKGSTTTDEGNGGATIPVTPSITREQVQETLNQISGGQGEPLTVKIGRIVADENLNTDELVSQINTKLTDKAAILGKATATETIDTTDLINKINESISDKAVSVNKATATKKIDTSTVITQINASLKEATAVIKKATADDTLDITELTNKIQSKLADIPFYVSKVDGSGELDVSSLYAKIKEALGSTVTEVPTKQIAKGEVDNVEAQLKAILLVCDDLKAKFAEVDAITLTNLDTNIGITTTKVDELRNNVEVLKQALIALADKKSYIIPKIIDKNTDSALNTNEIPVENVTLSPNANLDGLYGGIQSRLDQHQFTVRSLRPATGIDVSSIADKIRKEIKSVIYEVDQFKVSNLGSIKRDIVDVIQKQLDSNQFKIRNVGAEFKTNVQEVITNIDTLNEKIDTSVSRFQLLNKVQLDNLLNQIQTVSEKITALNESAKIMKEDTSTIFSNLSVPEVTSQNLQAYSKSLQFAKKSISKFLEESEKWYKGNMALHLNAQMSTLTKSTNNFADAVNNLFYALNAIEDKMGVVKDLKTIFQRNSKRKASTTKTKTTEEATTEDTQKAVDKAEDVYDDAIQQITDKVNQVVKDNEDLELSRVLRQIVTGNVKGRANKLLQGSTINDESKAVISKALGEYDKIVEEIEKGSYQGTQAADKWREAQQILVNSINTVFDSRHAEKNVTKLENLSSRINNLLANNSKVGSSKIGQDLRDLNREVKLLVQQVPDDQTTNAAIQKFEQLRSLMYETGVSGKSQLQKIGATISATFRRVFAGDVTYRLLMKIREIPTIVREIDSAMTDLKRVTSETADTYDKFLTTATQKATQLGATVTETIKATSSFGRLGYNLEEASTLAESALIYKNVGWLDIETATNDIVSAMKAFNLTAEDSLRIVDTFNILGNKFALTSADVGAGLKTSASALATANNTLEESTAMITAITEITQDASSAGNALKTLSLRIRSTKAELSEMGEDAEGAVTTTAKLRKQLMGITGVDILDKNGDFKSTYEIMKGIASVWKDLSDTEQASVLESLAGKVRANQVAALLNNWSQAEKALDESLNASGTALKENDVYLKSAEGRLSQLKATAQDLSLDIFNSDELKTFLKLATDLLQVFTKMGSMTIPVLSGIGIAGTAIKNPSEGLGMQIINAASTQSPLKRLKSQGYIQDGYFNFNRLGMAYNGALSDNAIKGITLSLEEQDKILKEVVADIGGLDDAQQRQIITAYKNSTADKQATLSIQQMGLAAEATAIKQTLLNAAIGAGIGLAITATIKFVTWLVQREEKLAESALAAADALGEQTKEIDNYKSRIVDLKNSLDDSNLSQADAYEVRKELLKIQDEMIDKYGFEKEKIDLLNKSLEENIAILDNQNKEETRATYRSQKSVIDKADERINTKANRWVDTYIGNLDTNDEVMATLEKYGYQLDKELGGAIAAENKTLYEHYQDLNSVIKELSNNSKLNNNEEVDLLINYLQHEIDKINTEKFQNDIRELNSYAFGEIYSNTIYDEFYTRLSKDVTAYQEAVAKGDTEAIQKALSDATRDWNADSFATMIGQETNFAILDIFNNLYDQIFGNTKENYKATVSQETKNSLSELLKGFNSTELKNAVLTNNEQFTYLTDEAIKAGLSVEELIDALTELGVVQADYSQKEAKTRTFKEIAEDIEDAQKALTAFDNAVSKMSSSDTSSAFLTADELNTLLGYDDTLIDSVEKTTKGYVISAEKLMEARNNYFKDERENIQANIDENNKQIDDYKQTIKDLEAQKGGQHDNAIDSTIKDVNEQIVKLEKETKVYQTLLNELRAPLIDFRASLSTITGKAETLGTSLSGLRTESEKFDYITEKTALNFISSNENWEKFIKLNEEGKYELIANKEAYTDLIKESTGYDAVLQGLTTQQTQLQDKADNLRRVLNDLTTSGKANTQEFDSFQLELDTTQSELDETTKQAELLKNILEALLGVFEKSDAVNTFNENVKNLKYELDMGEKTQAEYNQAYDEYVEQLAAVTDKDDEDLRNARVTQRQQHIQQETDEFEKAQKKIDTAYEQGNISLEQKIAQRRSLIEKYYSAGTTLGNTEDGKQKYQDYLNEILSMETEAAQKSYDERKKLIDRNREDNIISIDDQIEELKKLNEEYYNPQTGKLGKTRSAIDSKTYEENLREIENLSKQAYDYWVSEAERARKMGIINEEQLWQRKLDLAEQYLRPIAQLQDEYRDAQDEAATTGQQALYDEELRELENNRTLKIKNEKVYWGERYALAKKYYKDNAAFEKEWIQEDITYRTEGMRAMYEEDIKNSENAYKRGEISLSAHIHNMTVAWEQYYKGKKELREEDLQAQQTIQDEYKNGIQSQISAIEAVKSAETERLNGEIELLEESKAEYQRVAQEKEKAIDKEIRALQRQKDAIDKKTQAEKDSYEMAKAMINLYKASMNTRLVYTGGGWELQRDEQKYQDALKEVNEKKDEAQAKQLDKAIEALQEQKTAISDATSDVVDEIEKDITERQLEIKKIEAPFDQLTKILTSLIAKMTMENLDPQFISMILNSEGGQEAVDRYMALYDWITDQNKEYSKTGNKSLDEFYSYYKDRKPNNFISSNAYTQATRAALEIANDANTNSATKELIENFKINLRDSNMTNKELREWIERLAASNNMTFDEMAQKFGLADYFTDPAGSFKDALDIANNVVDKVAGQDDKTEETAETQASDMETITTSTTGIMTNTGEILKLIQNFSAANPNLFVGAEGNKISTTADVKNNAGKIADTINNSPVFNINVTGNADKSIVSTMRKELTNAFNEYTDILTGALGVAHQRQLTT